MCLLEERTRVCVRSKAHSQENTLDAEGDKG